MTRSGRDTSKGEVRKNRTQSGRRLGRRPKLLSREAYEAMLQEQELKPRRGRPKSDGLKTIDIIYAVLSKRPGFASILRDQDAESGKGYVSLESVKRRNSRSRQVMRRQTGVNSF